MSTPAASGRTRRPRRKRGVQETLLSITLVCEALIVFFAALVVFGLRALPAEVALGGGAAFLVLTAAASGVQRWAVGRALGWAIQVVLLAMGFLEPLMFAVGACFAALWIYCFVRGAQLDRFQAEAAARAAAEEPAGE